LDRELQYHVRMDLQRKRVRAVKRMRDSVHCLESRGSTPFRGRDPAVHFGTHLSRRIVPSRDGTIGAGLFQHISGI